MAPGYGAIARGQVEVLKVAQYTRSCMELLSDTVKDGTGMNMMDMLLANHTCTWCYSHGLHRIESSLGSNNNRNALGLPSE